VLQNINSRRENIKGQVNRLRIRQNFLGALALGAREEYAQKGERNQNWLRNRG
jgi:hypothetical protein